MIDEGGGVREVGQWMQGEGRGVKKIKREEGGRSGGREQGSDLDMDPDPWKIFFAPDPAK